MSSTVAIVAITSGATLSAAAITAFAGRVQAQARSGSEVEQMQARFRHERSLHDVDELRSVLDEAAEAIRAVRSIVAKPSGPEWLETGLAHLKPVQSKLAIRLGANHRLTESAASVVEALEDIESLYASADYARNRTRTSSGPCSRLCVMSSGTALIASLKMPRRRLALNSQSRIRRLGDVEGVRCRALEPYGGLSS